MHANVQESIKLLQSKQFSSFFVVSLHLLYFPHTNHAIKRELKCFPSSIKLRGFLHTILYLHWQNYNMRIISFLLVTASSKSYVHSCVEVCISLLLLLYARACRILPYEVGVMWTSVQSLDDLSSQEKCDICKAFVDALKYALDLDTPENQVCAW